MPEQLKVVIDADVNGAIAGVNKFARSVDGLTTGSIAQLRKASLLLRTQLENLSPTALQSDFGKQLTDTLKVVNTELKSLEAQSVKTAVATGNVFNKAFQSVKTLANILPGVGLSTIFGFAIAGITDLIQGLLGASDAADQAKSSIKNLNVVLSDSAASVQGDIARVSALVKAATDTASSFIVQKNAIAELKKINKDYFGDLDAGKSSYEEITKAADAYTQSIVNQAIISGLSNAISKLSEELGNTFIKYNDLTKKTNEARIALNKATQEQAGNAQGLTGQSQKINLATNAYNNLQAQLLTTGNEYGKINTRIKEFNDQIRTQILNNLQIPIPHIDDDKFKDETDNILARARLFIKEFGDAFVLPDLSDKFFTSKDQLLKAAKKVLDDAKRFISGDQTALKIKIPVLVTTETKVNADDLKKFLRDQIPESAIKTQKITIPVITDADFKLSDDLEKKLELTKDQIDELIKNFFKSFTPEEFKPIEIGANVDLTIPIDKNKEAIDKLIAGFANLGNIGVRELLKIEKKFPDIIDQIKEGSKVLKNMQDFVITLQQSVGTGLSNAFNSVFDAILEGKSVFKALGEAVKSLVVETIKAIAKMLILKAVARIFSGGVPLPIPIPGTPGGGQANLGFGAIGSSPFQNVLTINVNGQISGDVIRLAGQRAANSAGRFG